MFRKNKQSLMFFIIVIISIGFSPAVLHGAESHTPKFTWKILGGVVNPEQWIYDGDIPVAMFEQRFIEQPGENLLFFNGLQRYRLGYQINQRLLCRICQ